MTFDQHWRQIALRSKYRTATATVFGITLLALILQFIIFPQNPEIASLVNSTVPIVLIGYFVKLADLTRKAAKRDKISIP
ncbi:Na+/alanine symporter [Arthrobacter stackebrandtii]|uniref:Na+/alanine symporter n=1 Tax=Arthrobacter stackebrandtii TaxID=272161 RepID=A0ABS4YYK2_9MICC|nr:hypothetical protein [Arthrobacter stackebrandtii]MBP2413098.1 Na+/alanine symporter [Arthrobacter stackebrandtii]PYH01133.1 hypothetical protein CVV67_05945 [Arthrobacter stackebrandtii]